MNKANGKITIDVKKHFGKPCVGNTRIPVHAVLELIETGITFDDIIRNYYPDLTKNDIKACVEYALNIIKSEEIHIGSAK